MNKNLTSLALQRGPEAPGGGSRRRCPICGDSEAVSMVSGVSRAGRGRLILADGNIGEYETELARLLAEPARPLEFPLTEVLKASLIGAFMAIVTLGVVAALRWQDYVSIPASSMRVATLLGITWFAILIPVFTLARLLENRHRLNEELPRWRDAAIRWREVCYCSRDDIVFRPGSNATPLVPEEAFQLWAPPEVGTAAHISPPGVALVVREGAAE